MKYGILGIGQAGLRHFNAFNNIKNVNLLGFTEFDLKKAKKFEKKFNVKHFKKLEDIISLLKCIKKKIKPYIYINY